ncbi:hypothetical protein BDZ89DRAFT_950798 [Hymenopellis radicata]|nr:hypothetical protein BDZ89DRAFT_950798 [Hymenopellis radicata]
MSRYVHFIPNFNDTDDALNCPNGTFLEPLNTTGTVANGPMSIFGFVDQCTDPSIKPNTGTPPFTLKVTVHYPPLHPPFNLTLNTVDPITWTVSLVSSRPFFMSMVSSEGLAWAGPMHSRGGEICLYSAPHVRSSHVCC